MNPPVNELTPISAKAAGDDAGSGSEFTDENRMELQGILKAEPMGGVDRRPAVLGPPTSEPVERKTEASVEPELQNQVQIQDQIQERPAEPQGYR